jgi:hypothetical protein
MTEYVKQPYHSFHKEGIILQKYTILRNASPNTDSLIIVDIVLYSYPCTFECTLELQG